MRAVNPKEMPKLPEGASAWARSTKRSGGMFHAHAIGFAVCGSLRLDRHHSAPADTLGDMQYWGVCPKCLKLARSLKE